MSDAYFTNAVDNKWDTPGNWFSDSGFTTPLGTMSGLPDSYNDIYVYGTIDGYNSIPPNPLSHGTFYGNGTAGALYCANLGLNFTSDVIFNNGYFFTGNNDTLISSSTITFNNNSGMGNGAGGYFFSNAINASSIVFNNTSGGDFYGSSVYGNITLNNNANINNATFQNKVTLNDSSTIGTGPVVNTYCLDEIYLYDTSSADYVELHSKSVIYYPGTSSITNYSIYGTGAGIYYGGYNTKYFYSSSNTGVWSGSDDWWIDSLHTKKSYEAPDSSTEAIVDSDVFAGSGNTVNSLVIGSNNYIGLSTITVNTLATFNDSSYINSIGGISGDCLFLDSSYNEGTVTGAATFGVNGGTDNSYNGSVITGNSTFYASSYSNNISTLSSSSYFYNNSNCNASSILGPVNFYDNSTNTTTITTNAIFNDHSDNSGNCTNVTYNNFSTATGASYSTNIILSITGAPVNFSMDTSLSTYSFTRGGFGINGSSILGLP